MSSIVRQPTSRNLGMTLLLAFNYRLFEDGESYATAHKKDSTVPINLYQYCTLIQNPLILHSFVVSAGFSIKGFPPIEVTLGF